MAMTRAPRTTEGAIWNRLIQAERKSLTLPAARYFLRLEFAAEDKERMHELAARARDGTLTAAEHEEVRNYEQVGNLLALMKSKARQRLRRNGSANGARR
jgi:hypothetical protein